MMSLLIDGLILLLLAGTLAYAFLVDRRVRNLMAVLQELQPMVGAFSDAVDKSESSVNALRAAAQDMAQEAARVPAAAEAPARPAAKAARRVSPPGVTRVSGKTDLVRSFFESTRGSGA